MNDIFFSLGLDEAGRGPLAGPVYAGACLLGDGFPLEILNDSKRLTEKRREAAYKIIRNQAWLWGIAWVDPQEIDRLNIHHASLLAMTRAAGAALNILTEKEKCYTERGGSLPAEKIPTQGMAQILADGKFTPPLDLLNWPERPLPEIRAEIKGDGRFPCIMAASLLAKVARDRFMIKLAETYPQYAFEKHKGYPTRLHRERIALYGPADCHRRSFTLIR